MHPTQIPQWLVGDPQSAVPLPSKHGMPLLRLQRPLTLWRKFRVEYNHSPDGESLLELSMNDVMSN